MFDDDGGSKHLWNVGQFLPDYTAQRPRRQSLSFSTLWVSLHSSGWNYVSVTVSYENGNEHSFQKKTRNFLTSLPTVSLSRIKLLAEVSLAAAVGWEYNYRIGYLYPSLWSTMTNSSTCVGYLARDMRVNYPVTRLYRHMQGWEYNYRIGYLYPSLWSTMTNSSTCVGYLSRDMRVNYPVTRLYR
jgi:hypothetical protein